MTKFYSKNVNGFYDDKIHKSIPDDCVEISDEDYKILFISQDSGKMIEADINGIPHAIDRPILSGNNLIKSKIEMLESTQTPRRIREAAINSDNGWLADLNTKINILRSQL